MTDEQLESVTRLTRDIKLAALTLTAEEARYLVDLYYLWQEDRKRFANQDRALTESREPSDLITHFAKQAKLLETQCKNALDEYTKGSAVGLWARSQVGVGPVITAGLLAHIDIEKAPTAGHIWAFAGLDPTKEWQKGAVRPWNAQLKTLCWKLGESFVKVSNKDGAYYGEVYKRRKLYEQERNAKKDYAEQARRKLEKFKIGKDTDAYKFYSDGMLPPAHIQQRAKRYAVKLFLSHLHHIWFVDHFKKEPPMPYAIAHLGHAHYLEPVIN